MRKVIVMDWVSIDGYYAGPNGELDWVVNDPEVTKAVHEIGEGQSGILVCGRITYQGMEAAWPKVAADPNAPAEAKAMANEVIQMTKIVFSTTLKEVPWENSILHHGNLIDEIKKLKQSADADILIFGSGSITQTLTDAGLVDDYVLMVSPVLLGAGKVLFQGVKKVNLELVEARGFNSGNVLLHYKKA